MDAAAAQLGLRPGQPLAHAQAVVPRLHVALSDAQGDAAALRRLALWCIRYSPLVAADPPDGILLDVAGSEHLFGGEAALLADAVARLSSAGIFAQGAVAGTPAAAGALARHAPGACVMSGREKAALAPLPVTGLRLSEETVDGLRRLGIRHIGQLMEMPRAPLTRRFGPEIVLALDAALGETRTPIRPLAPPKLHCERLSLAEPISTAEAIAQVIRRLTPTLCASLERSGRGARRLDLLLQRVDGITAAVRIGTAAASRDAAHLAKLLSARIETVDPGFGIEKAVLFASRTERLGARQFAGDFSGEKDDADLSMLVDRLASRIGAGALYRMAPVESDMPERSVKRVPPLAPATGGSWPRHLPRPARLLAPPEAIATIATLPDDPPSVFTWRRTRHRIRRADGPERIFGEWWRSDTETDSVRDYYAVEDEDGARFWVFRDGITNGRPSRWFLHGVFG